MVDDNGSMKGNDGKFGDVQGLPNRVNLRVSVPVEMRTYN